MLNRLSALFGRRNLAATALACACGPARAQHHPPPPPGGDPSLRSRALAAGAAALQSKAPLDAMDMYLDGFHRYADEAGRTVRAHHFCTQLTEDFHQCVIFDGNESGSRLIGIEYIVSARVFATLPDGEKPLWHSHDHEVRSGLLVMPGIPEPVETAAMRDLASTYGKTFHTWQVDRGDALPLGIPRLMMSFTGDSQIAPGEVEARDRDQGSDTFAKRRARAGIPASARLPGADRWQSGTTPQLVLQLVPVR